MLPSASGSGRRGCGMPQCRAVGLLSHAPSPTKLLLFPPRLGTCRVSEQGFAVSVELWETDPRSEPAQTKSRRIDHERESTVHGSAHSVLYPPS